jgi:hypothetical protein
MKSKGEKKEPKIAFPVKLGSNQLRKSFLHARPQNTTKPVTALRVAGMRDCIKH